MDGTSTPFLVPNGHSSNADFIGGQNSFNNPPIQEFDYVLDQGIPTQNSAENVMSFHPATEQSPFTYTRYSTADSAHLTLHPGTLGHNNPSEYEKNDQGIYVPRGPYPFKDYIGDKRSPHVSINPSQLVLDTGRSIINNGNGNHPGSLQDPEAATTGSAITTAIDIESASTNIFNPIEETDHASESMDIAFPSMDMEDAALHSASRNNLEMPDISDNDDSHVDSPVASSGTHSELMSPFDGTHSRDAASAPAGRSTMPTSEIPTSPNPSKNEDLQPPLQPWKCSVCGVKVSSDTKRNIKRHLSSRWHVANAGAEAGSSQRFPCPVPCCEYSAGTGNAFTRKDNLKRHLQTKHGSCHTDIAHSPGVRVARPSRASMLGMSLEIPGGLGLQHSPQPDSRSQPISPPVEHHVRMPPSTLSARPR